VLLRRWGGVELEVDKVCYEPAGIHRLQRGILLLAERLLTCCPG
jgi:hypothetical protein